MDKPKIIINEMVSENIIPEDRVFEITDYMKEIYVEKYSRMFGQGNFGKSSNKNYALKLAGINLMKYSDLRAEQRKFYVTKVKNKSKSGIVYCISNTAFPGFYKIGITKNLDLRLRSYQTYDPHRNFKVEHYVLVEDARKIEKELLNSFDINIRKSEWVETGKVKDIILRYRPLSRLYNDCNII